MDEAITTALTTAFTNIQTNVIDIIGIAAPYALGIMGAVLAITIGIKVFKTLTGKA